MFTPHRQPLPLSVFTSPSPQRRPTIKACVPPTTPFNSITALIRYHINRFTASKCCWPRPQRRLRLLFDPWVFVLRGTTRWGNVGNSGGVGGRRGLGEALRHNANPTESGEVFHQRKSDGNGNCLAFIFSVISPTPPPPPSPSTNASTRLWSVFGKLTGGRGDLRC